MTQRAVPFFCPYCGDEDLQPYLERHGGWWCGSCRRAWTLSLIGSGTPSPTAMPPGDDIPAVPPPPPDVVS